MKSLYQYIKEAEEDASEEIDQDALNSDNPDKEPEDDDSSSENDDDDDKPSDEKLVRRGNIKFTIWEEPKKKVTWLDNNEKYQKIEYQYIDKDKNISIDFLLGFQDNSWKLWIGKIGAISYDDDPWCSFDTTSFSKGIVMALDKVEEFIDDVNENPDNWVQFYKQ